MQRLKMISIEFQWYLLGHDFTRREFTNMDNTITDSKYQYKNKYFCLIAIYLQSHNYIEENVQE
jgi:hypothetical protein